jgi:heme/copper-type cytochrome/quinol oxidase subunit 2
MSIVPGSASTGPAYSPAVITVSKDDNVILAVGNATAVPHGFTVEGYGISTEIPPGGGEVKIRATHPGTFKIYSRLGEMSQVATLVVQ